MQWLLMFLIGGLAGAACDQIHVRFGVLTYPFTDFLGQPWWVVPLFGAGTVVGGYAAIRFAARMPAIAASRQEQILDALIFLAGYLASGLFVGYPLALIAAYVAVWILRSPKSPLAFAYGALIALGGVVTETTLIHLGLFRYARFDFLGVPLWLPGLYLVGAPMALRIGRELAHSRSSGA